MKTTSVLAIDFGGTKVSVGVESPTGSRAVRTEQFSVGAPAPEVVALARRMASDLLDGGDAVPVAGAAHDEEPRMVVSIVTPGRILDDDGSGLGFAPNVVGWETLNLWDWAQEHWPGCEVQVTNDVAAAAMAEVSRGNLQECRVGLYLNLGTGIAAAVTVGGTVLAGQHGLAGEIGYAHCGVRGGRWGDPGDSLEERAGGKAFAGAGVRIPVEAAPGSQLGPEVTDRLDWIAEHLLTSVLLVDPRRVVVGGGMGRLPLVRDHLCARLRQGGLRDTEVLPSRFGSMASLEGAFTVGSRITALTIDRLS